jgi:hypothetical protein
MKTQMEIDSWLDALEWTPETAESCVLDIGVYLHQETVAEWLRVVPYISTGLECLADNPDKLYRLAAHLHNVAPPHGREKILAMILASVDAALPEFLVHEAITSGALVPILANRNYTLSQRLAWIKEYQHDVLGQGGRDSWGSTLETPIKDALALWFFMAATRGGYDFFYWGKGRLSVPEVSDKQFLEMNAPNLVERIDFALTLGLSYGEAVDMLIDASEGKQAEAMLDLPALNDPGRNL